jgi:DNA-directed RNA polymerase specialized sigma24 family protein
MGTSKSNLSNVQENLKIIGEILHKRLSDKTDNQVSAEISELFLPLLIRSLKKSFGYLTDQHLIETVAEDTLLNYLNNPHIFTPSKGSLIGYLYLDAYWNLKNLAEKEKKIVELYSPISEYEAEIADTKVDPETQLINKEFQDGSKGSPLTQKVLLKVTAKLDRELLQLMMNGVRETKAYAQVLKIEDLNIEEQKKIVKRHKDRLKKTIQREIGSKR